MNDSEKLDYLIGQAGLLRGEVAVLRAYRRAADVLGGVRVLAATGNADPAAVTAALAFLGPGGPTEDQIAAWAATHTLDEILAAVEAYLAPYEAIATHPSSELQPGEDWRPTAAFWAAHKSHDLWASVFGVSGEIPTPAPYVPAPDEKPSLFEGLGRPETEATLARLVPEVIERAEAGYTWAGNHVTEETLAANRAKLDVADPGWVDERLRRVLVLTGYPITPAVKTLTLERWIWTMWRTSRPNPGSPYWDGVR